MVKTAKNSVPVDAIPNGLSFPESGPKTNQPTNKNVIPVEVVLRILLRRTMLKLPCQEVHN